MYVCRELAIAPNEVHSIESCSLFCIFMLHHQILHTPQKAKCTTKATTMTVLHFSQDDFLLLGLRISGFAVPFNATVIRQPRPSTRRNNKNQLYHILNIQNIAANIRRGLSHRNCDGLYAKV
jgi:hypothetical protein